MDKFYEMLRRHAFGCRIELNANDTFSHATAESFFLDEKGIPLLLQCVERWGHHGVTALMSAVREWDPLAELRTKKYKAAREWLATQQLPKEIRECEECDERDE